MADYRTCLQHLEENTRLIDVAGLPVTIKPVPDEDLPGAVDPRVRAVRAQPPAQEDEVDPYTYLSLIHISITASTYPKG